MLADRTSIGQAGFRLLMGRSLAVYKTNSACDHTRPAVYTEYHEINIHQVLIVNTGIVCRQHVSTQRLQQRCHVRGLTDRRDNGGPP